MRRLKPIVTLFVPKVPRFKTDDELASSCRQTLLDSSAIELAEQGEKPWIRAALSTDSIARGGRNMAVAAVFAVYGAQLELLRLKACKDALLTELSVQDQKALGECTGLNKADRVRLAAALYELGRIQRECQALRDARLQSVREHAALREKRLRGGTATVY